MAELTNRQTLFVAYYVKSLNATQSAIKAGYAPKSADVEGARLLGNAKVADAVARALTERLAVIGADPDSILEEVAAIAFSRLGDFASWGPGRFELRDSEEVDTRAVAGVTIKEITITNDHGEIVKVEQGIKTHDKLAALKLLGQRAGIFVDRKEITGKDGGPLAITQRTENLSDDEIKRRIAELDSRAATLFEGRSSGVPGDPGGEGGAPGDAEDE